MIQLGLFSLPDDPLYFVVDSFILKMNRYFNEFLGILRVIIITITFLKSNNVDSQLVQIDIRKSRPSQ